VRQVRRHFASRQTFGESLQLRRLDDAPVPLLCSLSRDAKFCANTLPGHPGAPGDLNGFTDLALTSGPSQGSAAQEMLGNTDLVLRNGVVVLEPLGELVGVVEDVLYRSGHRGHLKNLERAVMA